MTSDSRPIGLFDSGIGGLTVLKSLLASLPLESFVYLGDTARLPYGSKSPATIRRYLKQNIHFLGQLDVKAIVVACNSASTVLLDHDADFTIPIYNVIEPGAKSALQVSSKKRIGVLGTKATVASRSYVTTLMRLEPNATVYQQACPLLVPLVEEGWDQDPLTNLIVFRYVQPLLKAGIDTLILGCTHYPALRESVSKVAGPSVALVDSASAIANQIKSDIEAGRLVSGQERAALRLMTTDISPGFSEVAARLMRPYEIPALECVDIVPTR